MVVNILYALEKLLVEGYLIVKIGEQGHHLLLGLGNGGRLVGAGKTVKHIHNAVEQDAALFKSKDGVLKGRLLFVIDNLLYIVTLFLDSHLNGRQIVGLLYLAEIGSTKWQAALL